jgi:hypothetical protein
LDGLVGGFLDVHAIIRLEGAASSWYPVYDRVLPGWPKAVQAHRSRRLKRSMCMRTSDAHIRRTSAVAPSPGDFFAAAVRLLALALATVGADAALLPGCEVMRR